MHVPLTPLKTCEELLRRLSSRLRNSHPEELSNLLRASSCPEGTGILGRELSNKHVEMKKATGNRAVILSIVTHTYNPSTRQTEGKDCPGFDTYGLYSAWQTSLGYTVRCSFHKTKQTNKQNIF